MTARRARGMAAAARVATVATTLALLATAPVVQPAFARVHGAVAARPKVSAEVDRTSVGIGEVVEYSVTFTTSGDASPARSASPGNLDGFDLLHSTSSTHQSIMAVNGNLEVTTSVTITYRLLARQLGPHVLGPARAYVDGAAVGAPKVVVTVVAAGAGQPGKNKPQPDPFFDDPFFGGGAEPLPQPDVAPVDPLARVDELPTDPAERTLFVRVVPDLRRPVVGQQVTARLFVYSRRHPRISVKRPPGFAEFATIDLGQLDHDWHPITIGGETWSYANIGAYALFPLRTGSLPIGPAEIEYSDPFGGSGPRDLPSNALTIESIEPPTQDRPNGYVLGDVASGLTVTAEVVPRDVIDGHALLTVRMRGDGRLDPLRPILPTLDGITWTATGDEARTKVEGTSVRGVRKSTWDLAFDRAEAFDLGEVRVQVWDARKGAYVVARAPLGRVRIARALAPAGSASAAPLSSLPPARDDVGADGLGTTLADRAWSWGLVGALPLAVVLAQGGAALLRRRGARRARRGADPMELADLALTEARAASRKGDPQAAAGALGRALDRALEAATGVRARGLTARALPAALDATSLPAALRTRVASTLAAIEAARFSDGAMPAVDEVAAVVDELRAATPRSS